MGFPPPGPAARTALFLPQTQPVGPGRTQHPSHWAVRTDGAIKEILPEMMPAYLPPACSAYMALRHQMVFS